MANGTFKITIEGPGTNISHEVDAEIALQILSIVGGNDAGGTQTIDTGGGSGASGTTTAEARRSDVSIGEFLAGMRISNNYDRIAAIALYAREELGQPLVSKGELPNFFKRAGLKAPADLARDLKQAVSNNLIAEDTDEADSYYVTTTGESQLHRSE